VSALGLFAFAALGLLLLAFASGVETGAYALNRARLRLGVAEGNRRAQLLAKLAADLPSLLAAVVVSRTAAHALVSFAATLLFARVLADHAEFAAALTVAPLAFVLGELAPKELSRRHADGLMAAAAPTLAIFEIVLAPITAALSLVRRGLREIGLAEKKEDERALAAEELRLTIQASTEEGVLTAFQASLARNILTLRHRLVSAAMVPLSRVKAVEAATPLPRAREIAAECGCSRLLVFRERLEDAIGAVSVYDLFLETQETKTIDALVRPAPRISPADRVEDALLRLRLAREKLAIVARPGEKTLGIVTLKDLCEEITGELDDL
jgi:putative hemolysin